MCYKPHTVNKSRKALENARKQMQENFSNHLSASYDGSQDECEKQNIKRAYELSIALKVLLSSSNFLVKRKQIEAIANEISVSLRDIPPSCRV